jgi:hypothetical protein
METKTELVKIRIGKKFWDDHVSRGCLIEYGENRKDHEEDEYLVKETKTTVTLLLPEFQIHELLSDAWHYSTGGYEEMPELVQSARGTCRAVLKQLGLPIPYTL